MTCIKCVYVNKLVKCLIELVILNWLCLLNLSRYFKFEELLFPNNSRIYLNLSLKRIIGLKQFTFTECEQCFGQKYIDKFFRGKKYKINSNEKSEGKLGITAETPR